MTNNSVRPGTLLSTNVQMLRAIQSTTYFREKNYFLERTFEAAVWWEFVNIEHGKVYRVQILLLRHFKRVEFPPPRSAQLATATKVQMLRARLLRWFLNLPFIRQRIFPFSSICTFFPYLFSFSERKKERKKVQMLLNGKTRCTLYVCRVANHV